MNIRSALVLGGGSAGFLAALALKTRVPGLSVTLIRSPDIGIIGVGEGTTASVTHHLHSYLKFSVPEFFALAKPQWKLGLRMIWGSRPYFDYTFKHQIDTHYSLMPRGTGFYLAPGTDFSRAGVTSALMANDRVFMRGPDGYPNVGDDVAYHIDNELLVGYLERHVREAGVTITDGTVERVERADYGVKALHLNDGTSHKADLFVDASGFGSVLLGQTMKEPFESFKSSLFCDKAVVGGWARTTEAIKPYTTVETMDSGWCWQIEHEHRINRGYVYSADFISDTDAEADYLFSSIQQRFTDMIRGKRGYLKPPIDDIHAYWSADENMHASRMLACSFVGSPDTVRRKLDAFVTSTGVDELMVASAIFEHQARLRSYELLAELRNKTAIVKAA